jgi:RNA polymerase sigma-70 factor, ECF subfamily
VVPQWFRNIFKRPREVELESFVEASDGPAELLERKEARAALHRLLGRMSEKRRAAFVLFEVEGYSGEEIASLLDVPLATVWTRLHHARKDFLALVEELQQDERANRS